jgi:hypothetical protein
MATWRPEISRPDSEGKDELPEDDDDDDNNNKLQLGFHPWQWLIYMYTIATKFTSGGPHEKLAVATCSVGNRLSVRF